MVSSFDQIWNKKESCHTHCFDLKSLFQMSVIIRGVEESQVESFTTSRWLK